MSLPLLSYQLSTQNSRVSELNNLTENKQFIYSTDPLLTGSEMDMLIMAAYRQIVNEQQMLNYYRQPFLESQLRAGQITVKEFIRGLILSDNFQRLTYRCNNNYRFVKICIQRLLGRDIYDQRETFAWSIVLATKGIKGFIDELLNSDEYIQYFDDDTVPYQRNRKIPQRELGEITFEHMARYGEDFRDLLPPSSYVPPKISTDFGPIKLSEENSRVILAVGTLTGVLILLWLISILLFQIFKY